MQKKIDQLLARLPEIEQALGEPSVFDDQKRYKELSQEHAYLTRVKHVSEELFFLRQELKEQEEQLLGVEDEEWKDFLLAEKAAAEKKLPLLEERLQNLLVPPDPNDHRAVIMELRAGTGGEEAALFVGNCVRMYRFFAESQGWNLELLSCTASDLGGYREYIMVVSGENAHRFLQYEGGTHRVQRVPDTETQGRVHTSAITVAILLEPDEEEDIVIDEKELRIDTMRSSGAGGQHVNTTDSAVRITHLPTRIMVYCQEEKSQHKNKDTAMRLLKAKLVALEKEKKAREIADKRMQQVGSGDRSERIRTYNYPQNRVTDHRIGLTLYHLERVMDGDLEMIISPVVTYYYQKQLSS